MKKMVIAATVVLALVAGAWAEFAAPSAEQITAAAKDAAQIKPLLKDATAAQASSVLLRAVQQVQLLDLTPDKKKERIGELFAAVQEVMGDNAVVVISDVASRIDPALLPAVAAPGAAVVAQPSQPIALPLAPPVAPPYAGQ